MEFLPNLDIEEDISNLMDDEDLMIDITQEDLSAPIPELKPLDDIFVGKPTNGVTVFKPTNKKKIQIEKPDKLIEALQNTETLKNTKKPLSEKQKAHLIRIRKLAMEKKQEKAILKKEALEKINEEYISKKNYKKRTIKINDEIPEIKNKIVREPNNLSEEDNNIKQNKKKQPLNDEQSFCVFMENMGKYQNYMNNYKIKMEEKQKIENPKINIKKAEPIHQPQPKPIPQVLKNQEKDIYAGIFNW